MLNTDGVFKAHQCWRVTKGDVAELWILTQVPTIIPVRVTWILRSNANVTTEIFSLPLSIRIYNSLVHNYPIFPNASTCTNPITPVIPDVTLLGAEWKIYLKIYIVFGHRTLTDNQMFYVILSYKCLIIWSINHDLVIQNGYIKCFITRNLSIQI